MKTKLLTALFAMMGLCAYAQTGEPDFTGEVNYVENEGNYVPLEKQRVVIKTKAGASMFLIGMGKIKTKINVAGERSRVRISKRGNLQFIVRADDNSSDPMSIVSIFRFKPSGKARKAELSSMGTFGGASNNKLDYIDYTAKKYGESSYLITIPAIEAGEFGITVANPNNQDEKQMIVSCFGVD